MFRIANKSRRVVRLAVACAALVLAIATSLAVAVPAARAQAADASLTIEVFTREGCPRCAKARSFLDELAGKRPGLQLVVRDVGADPSAAERFRRLAAEHGVSVPGLPSFLVRGAFITGFVSPETTGARLVEALDREQGTSGPIETESGPAEGTCPVESTAPCAEPAPDEGLVVPVLGRIDARDLGLPLFTLVIGLLDGFNPCAMWVLLLLLSFLAGLRSRSKMIAVGGTFVLVSGLVYFAFMAAWLNVFLLIGLSRAAQIALGAIALGVGALNVKDFFAFKKGPSLSIPDAVKPGLYRRMRAVVQAEHVLAAMASAAVIAMLVNVVELLCTAGFPAVYTRILTLRKLPAWQYYGYLGLYNVAYVADDALMLCIAVVTLGRRKLQEREGRWLKLVSGIVMAALGAVLILRPSAVV